jgi:histone deacetylase complex regulatory component SIN3
MKNKIMIGVIALFMLSTTSAVFGQNLVKDWKMLGTRVVDYTLDHDVVSLNNSQEAFTSLKVVVKNGSLNMHKATIHFANGDKQDITFPDVVTTESDGRIIDLKGNDRVIEKVTFWYDTRKAASQKATIEVYGKRS